MTSAEKEFYAMFRLADVTIFNMGYGGDHTFGACAEGDLYPLTWGPTPWHALGAYLAIHHEPFGILGSKFEALTIERPELREHYERAKQAWEASQ